MEEKKTNNAFINLVPKALFYGYLQTSQIDTTTIPWQVSDFVESKISADKKEKMDYNQKDEMDYKTVQEKWQ